MLERKVARMRTKTESPNPEAGGRSGNCDLRPSILRKQINAHFGAVRAPLPPPRQSWYLSWKAAFEWLIALVLLVLTFPLIALAAILVKLTSPGPAIYRQTRVGRKGRLFTILKFRTMLYDCEALTGPRWSVPNDPRVTWIGRLLRSSHLDELPQLVNVLRGDMSLIGPRPERPEFLPHLYQTIPGYPNRLAVRPGVTGLAQVNLPPDTSLASVRLKLAYDLCYIRNLSFLLDLRILLATALYSVGVPFRCLRPLFGAFPVEPPERVKQPLPEKQAPETKVRTAA